MKTGRPELGELKPGQPVMVCRSMNDYRRSKPEDRYIPAVVVKASRVWVDIEKPGSETWSVNRWRMRRDTQDEATQYPGNNASFATLEQHAWDLAAIQARQVLRDNGITLDLGSPWRGREIELAALITGKGDESWTRDSTTAS
jgi:hypothetical protein